MNRLMKRHSRSNRTSGESAAMASVAGGAAGEGVVDGGGATTVDPVADGAPRAGLSQETGAAMGGAATNGGFPLWPSPGSSFGVHPPPGTSDWMYAQDGFMNMLQSTKAPCMNYPNGSNLPQNNHFVGGILRNSRTPSPAGSSAEGIVEIGSQDKETIDVDEDDNIQPAGSNARSNARSIAASIVRLDRRLNWSNEEDIRLVSAWLHNSIDPVDGNDKKADQYWSDVTSTYNSPTKCDRIRNRNQLKLRWERIKKPVTEFNGCYTRITKVHQSGFSDDQKMDQALQLYASEHSDKPFTMVHLWKILRHEKKWSAYVKKISNEKDKSGTANPAQVVNVEDDPKPRPVGHKRAKEERNGKRPAPEGIAAIDQKLDKFIAVGNKAEQMAEVQERLANKKLEVAKLNHKAAQEQTKGKMLELYSKLLCAPTNDLSEEAAAERTKALEAMALALFAKDN